MKNLKILVVGQGIAGTVLALTLRQAGVEVWCRDGKEQVSCSDIAAGVINPVTGKRYAKSWNFDLFYPFAKQFYTQIEPLAKRKIWLEYPILRLLGSPLESNEWNLRSARPEFAGLMYYSENAGEWESHVKPGFMYGGLNQAGRVEFEALMQYNRSLAEQENRWIPRNLETAEVEELLHDFTHIIFSEGYRSEQNPYFPQIPWQSAKGDRLLIRLPQPQPRTSMLKKQIIVAPVAEDLYWAGANYYWEYADTNPTPKGLQFIENELNIMLQSPYQIVDHSAAVRPVIKDRRPIMGWSQKNPKIGIFNGLGSKGALLAPWCAAHFVANLCQNSPIDSELDVQRFDQTS